MSTIIKLDCSIDEHIKRTNGGLSGRLVDREDTEHATYAIFISKYHIVYKYTYYKTESCFYIQVLS